ncbi:hypothetical protein AMECASPLE_036118, partial [Ameca splendens]
LKVGRRSGVERGGRHAAQASGVRTRTQNSSVKDRGLCIWVTPSSAMPRVRRVTGLNKCSKVSPQRRILCLVPLFPHGTHLTYTQNTTQSSGGVFHKPWTHRGIYWQI